MCKKTVNKPLPPPVISPTQVCSRRWLRPALYAKLCRQFDTFWFELRGRMRMFDAIRQPMPSSTRARDGLEDTRIALARYPAATITTTGAGQSVVWIYANGGN